jgi:opacity protein-like surface antigen
MPTPPKTINKKNFLTILILSYLLLTNQLIAGNGYYIGADYLRNSTKIKTSSTISGALSTNISSENKEKSTSRDYGFRFGYRHKIHKYLYIAPEFFYQKLDPASYLYSTTLKAGLAIKDFSVFSSVGYAEIDRFNNSAENFGAGIEYKINDNFSLTAEYIKFGDIETTTTETSSSITTSINKVNKVNTVKFGITYYFHE